MALVLALSYYSLIKPTIFIFVKCSPYTILFTSLDYWKNQTFWKLSSIINAAVFRWKKLNQGLQTRRGQSNQATCIKTCGFWSFAILSVCPMNKRLFDQYSMLFVKSLEGWIPDVHWNVIGGKGLWNSWKIILFWKCFKMYVKDLAIL